MTDWNRGSQPYCTRHGFVYHSCCNECRWEHGKEHTDWLPCKACDEAPVQGEKK